MYFGARHSCEAYHSTVCCSRQCISTSDKYCPQICSARARFSAVAALVKARKKNLQTLTADQQAFAEQKDLANGRKTFKAYLWQVCGEEYDAQHNG